MPYFDEKPHRFRVFFAVLFTVLFVFSVIHFYRLIESPTDENWFTNTPTPFYIVEDVPAKLLKADKSGRFALKPARVPDSLLVGDILLPHSKKISLAALIDSLHFLQKHDSVLTCTIYRPKYNQVYTYRVASAVMPDTLIRLLPPSVAVFDVAKGGASDRAGMKAGDLIVTINQRSFKDMFEADRIMRTGRTGKSIVYEIVRRNEKVQLNVVLARFGIPFSLLIFMITGLTYMGLGLFLGIMRPQINASRLLALGFTLFGCVLMLMNTMRQPIIDSWSNFITYPLPAMLYLSIAVILHSNYYFPRPSPLLLQKRWLQILPYAIALICSVAIYLGKGAIWINRFVLLMVLISLLPLFFYRKQFNPENKRLLRIIRLALMVCIGLLIVLVWYVNRYAGPLSTGYIGFPLMLVPAAYLYTIGRYRLLDMNLRIRRNIRFSLAVMLWIFSLVIIGLLVFWRLPSMSFSLPNITLTGSSIEVLDSPKSVQEQATLEKGLLMVLAVLLVFGLWKIGRLGVRFLAKHFHRDHYDYRRAAQLVNQMLSKRIDLSDLAVGLGQRVNELMHLQQVGVLFFRETDQIACGHAEGLADEKWSAFRDQAPALMAALADWLPNPDRFAVEYLPEKPKQKLYEFGFRYLVPIYSSDRLRGLFLLGEKRSESPFYQEDYQFLRSISQQVSVAVENALLYEQLAQRERLRHELEIARRIQLASLPQDTPRIPGLEIAGWSLPALEVGGDYYDYLNGSDDELTVVVGDVSGKGISAALYMSKVQGILRSLHSFHLSPRDLCIHLNDLLDRDLEKNYFVTALAAAIQASERRLILTRAGHLPLYHFRMATHRVELLTPRGIGFGLDQKDIFEQELEEYKIVYQSGDVFLFVTDGVTESRNRDGEEFGEMNLMSLLMQHADKNARELCQQVVQELQRFAGVEPQAADLTVVVVKAS